LGAARPKLQKGTDKTVRYWAGQKREKKGGGQLVKEKLTAALG